LDARRQNLDPSGRVSRAGEYAREPSLPFGCAQGSPLRGSAIGMTASKVAREVDQF